MNKLILAVLIGIVAYTASAEVYKWTDSQGITHFSDRPHDGAETIKIPNAQTFSPPSPSTPKNIEAIDGNKVTTTDLESPKYLSISITQPLNQSTIRNNQGLIQIVIEVIPELAPGDKVQILLDGTALGEPQHSEHFELSNINRGSHTLLAKIINKKGEEILASDSITVHVHRPRVGMANGRGTN